MVHGRSWHPRIMTILKLDCENHSKTQMELPVKLMVLISVRDLIIRKRNQGIITRCSCHRHNHNAMPCNVMILDWLHCASIHLNNVIFVVFEHLANFASHL